MNFHQSVQKQKQGADFVLIDVNLYYIQTHLIVRFYPKESIAS